MQLIQYFEKLGINNVASKEERSKKTKENEANKKLKDFSLVLGVFDNYLQEIKYSGKLDKRSKG